MQVNVQNTRADFDAFSDYLVRHRYGRAYTIFRYALPIVCGGGSILLLLLLWWLHLHSHPRPNQQLSAFVGALVCLMCAFAWPLWTRFNFFVLRRKGSWGTPFTLELREGSVVVRQAAAHNQASWSEFHRVDRTANHLFFLINTRSALIVPLSAFPSSGVAETFADFATTRWQIVQNTREAAPLAAP